jgi:hypothetical protein
MASRLSKFRLLVATACAVSIAGPAFAQACVQPAERTAFELRALQSQLMVAALSCGRDNEYNAFVRKFQRDLSSSYTTMQSHYRRVGGSGQREMDGFITALANAHSQDGIRQGSQYCPNITPLFTIALAQPNAAALADLVVERNVVNPLSTPICPDRPAAAPARAATPRTTR